MSILYAHQGLTPPQLARRVLGLSPFQQVSAEQFRALLRHLIDIDHIQQTERADLIIGYSAEKIVNNYKFFAVFADDTDYRVRDKSREIGTIPTPPAVDDTLVLAGYIWRVLRVDYQQKIVEVTRAGRKGHQRWFGGGADIHTRVLQRMRRLLLEDSQHSYMRERAVERLRLARDAARGAGVAQSSILSLTDSQFLLLPWHGTRQCNTLMALLRYAGLSSPGDFTPYYIEVAGCDGEADLREALQSLCDDPAQRLPTWRRKCTTWRCHARNTTLSCRPPCCAKPTPATAWMSMARYPPCGRCCDVGVVWQSLTTEYTELSREHREKNVGGAGRPIGSPLFYSPAFGLPPRSPVSTGGRFRRALHNSEAQSESRVPSF